MVSINEETSCEPQLDLGQRRQARQLDIVLLKPGTRINAVSIFYRIVSTLIRHGSLFDDPSLEILHATELLIHGSHRVGVTLDGEVRRFVPPVYIAIQPDALRVIAPPDGVERKES